jgi:hypothetical protein
MNLLDNQWSDNSFPSSSCVEYDEEKEEEDYDMGGAYFDSDDFDGGKVSVTQEIFY